MQQESMLAPTDGQSKAANFDLLLYPRRNLFFCKYEKSAQVCSSKRSGHGHIGGIPARCHEHTANTRLAVAGVECPPTAIEIHLKPSAKVHGKNYGDADVAEVTSRIACWNVECAAKGDRQMLIVATYGHAFSKNVKSRHCRPGMLIVERHFVVDPIANGLYTAPARRDLSEQFKRNA
jgi:hypothetical protein